LSNSILDNFRDLENNQECLKIGHQWEYYQTNLVDIDTVEIEYFCCNCSHTQQEYMFKFVEDTVLKEAKKEDRLTKQLLITMLSAYSNNPINLLINAPSGVGKNYVINKVAELFPEYDVISLAGMTDKALFHRSGKLVIKNELSREYESIEDRIKDIDEQIEENEFEISQTNNRDTKQALRSTIRELKQEKKDLLKDARKLIDLSNKIIIFLDTPSERLLSGLLPLLSHDKYEVEYEYVDTHNGIKTKNNVLKG
jgi:hypothetical protein